MSLSAADLVAPSPYITDEELKSAENQISDWWGYWFVQNDNAAVQLQQQFEDAWRASRTSGRAIKAGEGVSGFNRRLDLEKIAFLCKWKDGAAPSGNLKKLPFCDQDNDIAIKIASEIGQNRAAANANSAAREREFESSVAKMSSEELCIGYHAGHTSAARKELVKRGALSAADWTAIDRGRIWVGVSELALLCARGAGDHVNRTVTAGGERKQYVYGDGAFVYVRNGRVAGFQE